MLGQCLEHRGPDEEGSFSLTEHCFSAPLRAGVTRDVPDVIDVTLPPGELGGTGLIQGPPVSALVEGERSGREDRSKQTWQLLTHEFWYRQTRRAGVGL